MRHEHLWAFVGRYKPVTRDRNSLDFGYIFALRLFPGKEIHGSGKWREHHELREREAGSAGKIESRFKGVFTVCRQTEDERTQDMYAVVRKSLKALDQLFAGTIEIFIDRF